MQSLDKKQIKRMTVEVRDFDPDTAVHAQITIRLWNATGTPLYDLPTPGGERNAPVEVLFQDMGIDVAVPFVPSYGTKIVERGVPSFAPPANTTPHTETVWLPTLNPTHDTALVVFEIGISMGPELSPVQGFVVQCGNATYVGVVNIGQRPN